MVNWTSDTQFVNPWGFALVSAWFVTWSLSRRNAARAGLDTSHVDLLVPLSLFLGIAGAWAWWQLSGFRIRLLEVVVCAAIVVFAYSRTAKLSYRDLLDYLALPVLAGIAVLRVGCVIAGCCWGDVASSVPGIEYPPGSFAFEQHAAMGLIDSSAAGSLPVHAVQLYEIVFLLIAIGLGTRIRNGARGWIAAYAASAYAIGRFFFEFLRADSEVLAAGLTLVQAQCVVLFAVVATLLCATRRTGRTNA